MTSLKEVIVLTKLSWFKESYDKMQLKPYGSSQTNSRFCGS